MSFHCFKPKRLKKLFLIIKYVTYPHITREGGEGGQKSAKKAKKCHVSFEWPLTFYIENLISQANSILNWVILCAINSCPPSLFFLPHNTHSYIPKLILSNILNILLDFLWTFSHTHFRLIFPGQPRNRTWVHLLVDTHRWQVLVHRGPEVRIRCVVSRRARTTQAARPPRRPPSSSTGNITGFQDWEFQQVSHCSETDNYLGHLLISAACGKIYAERARSSLTP